ncbi:hypothetical protein DFH09DRAFT_1339740 [Mycena vulgaris]|nr:hypothetical protein DFH09DRAFT_1339740 [Mycena vulgaris]
MSTNLYDAFESYISQRILYAKVSTPKEHITLQPVLKFNGDSVLLPCPLHEYTGHGTSSVRDDYRYRTDHINDSLFREGANG